MNRVECIVCRHFCPHRCLLFLDEEEGGRAAGAGGVKL